MEFRLLLYTHVYYLLMVLNLLPLFTRSSDLHHVVLLPNVIRLETPEVITLTSLSSPDDFYDVTYHVYLKDHPGGLRTFSERNVTVLTGEVVNCTIEMSVADVPESPLAPLLVTVVVETTSPSDEHFRKEADILVNQSPGYIFIQTDKPLYTPDQSVLSRVITLDDSFRPVAWPLQVDIENPDGVIISRKMYESTDLIYNDRMKIPFNPVYGNWTVTARFSNGLKTMSRIRFEVKEYILPTFSVQFFIPEDKRVVLPSDTEFNLVVGAEYMHGKPVRGHVTLAYGILWHGHVFPVGKQRSLQLNSTGFTNCRISIEDLRLPVQNIWFPNGGKLHLQAAVTETASGRVEKASDVSAVFSDHMYFIKFTRSSRFFKPGLSYILQYSVLRANGQPAKGLAVEVVLKTSIKGENSLASVHSNGNHRTDALGRIRVEYLIPRTAKRLVFQLTPEGTRKPASDTQDSPGSTYYFQALPFFSPSNVFMQIHAVLTDIDKQESVPRVGDMLTVTAKYTSAQNITTVNLVVLSRGHIVWQTRTLNLMGDLTTFHFTITQAMSPGIRIVVFSLENEDLGSEVIADSVWVDIEGQCDGEVTLTRDERKTNLEPKDPGSILVRGPPNSTVGMLAIDKAVLLLNRDVSLTREKVFKALLDNDRGCGYGGGKDSANVFENAGLSVMTNAGLAMDTKVVEGCIERMVRKRKRRSVPGDAARRVRDQCCLEGAKVKDATLPLCFHIAQLLKGVLTSKMCSREFLKCCRDSVKARRRMDPHGKLVQPAAGEPFDDVELTLDEETGIMADVPLRTNFPESWWFDQYELGPTGEKKVDFVLPDSITTWSIQAMGVSQKTGLCLAPPLDLTTFKSFFVHIDLPYSVVRLEQLEVRVTVYNYIGRRLKVSLVLMSVESICYSGQSEKATEIIKLEVPPHDASSAYFPIVALEIGEFPLRVMAFSHWGSDAVEKTLRVEGEGVEKIHSVSIMLDPSGKRLRRPRSTINNETFTIKNEVLVADQKQSVELDLELPQDVIPDTDDCTIHAMGDLLGPTIQVMIDGVSEFLRLPTGCGEQNLIYLAPSVFVTKFLEVTNRLTPVVHKKAMSVLREGIARQLTFRKSDASFATWPHADSSTWLTAFAMKTLCQARHYSTVDHNQTCESFAWIAQQQKEDGSFREEVWVTHREMLGGINGDVSHTAFILVALLECDCDVEGNREVISKATRYVETNAFLTDRPLAMTLSAYALTLSGSLAANRMFRRMENHAKSSVDGYTYWGPGESIHFNDHKMPYWYINKPDALEVETTSYALLTYLARGEVSNGTNIVSWLLQQRNEHGAFVSTQDSVIGLQALAEYSIKTYSSNLDMTCYLRSEVDDRFRKSISLTPENAMVLKTVPKVPTGGKLHLEAEGTGVGLMKVEVRYNIPEDQEDCHYEVKVNTQRHTSLLQSFFGSGSRQKCVPCTSECTEDEEEEEEEFDMENFTFPPIIPRIQTLWGQGQRSSDFDLILEDVKRELNKATTPRAVMTSKIGRPRRSVTTPYSVLVVCIEVCVRFKGETTRGMTVVDVGLFTGFAPVDEDLEALKLKGAIDHFEKSKRSIIFYIDDVTNKETTCLKFRARQELMAHNLQPARVQVFDYYNPADRCSIFYKSNNRSGQLVNFCDSQKQICQCLESRCSNCEERWQGLRWMDLMKYACHNSSYVLEIKSLDQDHQAAGFQRVLGQVTAVHSQRGNHKLKAGDKVILLKRSSCFCPRISTGKTFMMMLSAPKRFKDGDGNQIYAFLMDKQSFTIEYHKPKKTKGLSKEQRATSKNVRRMLRRLKRRGCNKGSSRVSRNKQKRQRRKSRLRRRNRREKHAHRKRKQQKNGSE